MTDDSTVTIRASGVPLEGDFTAPDDAYGVVLFAHGSGSSRHSPRNRMVAARLRETGLATLLVDLLTEDEEKVDERTTRLRFDVEMLAARLVDIIDWLAAKPAGARSTTAHALQAPAASLPVGLFGASTGAAAALIAAAARPGVRAVVSRGGRPDLAGPALRRVRVPTLLIVGGADNRVLELNRQAMQSLGGPCRLHIVPGASHLFTEPKALETVAFVAASWFDEYLHRVGDASSRPLR
jgi:dienelactone hydrolase